MRRAKGQQRVEAGCLIADTPMAAYSRQCEPALTTEHHRALRFWNDEVLGNLDDIRGTIADEPGGWIRIFGSAGSAPCVFPDGHQRSDSFRRFHPGSALIVFPAFAGSMSVMGTGLRRCDKVVGASVDPPPF
jgi:hypothetical protein